MMRLKGIADREPVLSPRMLVAVPLNRLFALLTYNNTRNVPETRPRPKNVQTNQLQHT
jgi:hypothetical protein